MSSMISEVQADERPCPVCPEEYGIESMVEPEIDGDHRYWECEECGYAWGYERVAEGVRVDGSCSMGVPESVRRGASAGMEAAMEAESGPMIAGATLQIRRAESD